MPKRAALFAFLTALAGLISTLSPAFSAERITQFLSDIEITRDAALLVTETLDVKVEGRQIKRGIFRDFPTTYKDRAGNRVRVGFEVLEVQRDGAPEPYTLESLSNGNRIRIGQADTFLTHGIHTYVLTYKTTRQIGFFKDFDELYWNVTGSDWAFPIDAAQTRITIPGGPQITQHAAYTGRPGEQGTGYLESISMGSALFETTRTLEPGEGLTIAIAWPKGFVTAPTASQRFGYFLSDNAVTGTALMGLIIVLLYYLFAWHRFGRDPDTGVIIPRFAPPKGLSPAATRFVRRMAFDQKAYSAAIIDMAVKGYVTIDEEEDKTYSLQKVSDGDPHSLSKGEKHLAKALLDGGGSIIFDNKNHARIRGSRRVLQNSLKDEFEKSYFLCNRKSFGLGLLLSALVIIAAGIVSIEPAPTIILGIATAFITAVISYYSLRYIANRYDPVLGAGSGVNWTGSAFGINLGNIMIVALFFFFTEGLALSTEFLASSTNLLQVILFAALGGINVVFYYLLKAPTRAGRAVMDEIEGFRLYLAVAEQDRMNMLNPPEKTPALFEKYLPFALALDVENEWSEQFAQVLAAASRSPDEGGQGYHPRWYRGGAWKHTNMTGFSATLGAGLTQATAASATAPGSSSGSSGGGSSSGGGGGGGGGGW